MQQNRQEANSSAAIW